MSLCTGHEFVFVYLCMFASASFCSVFVCMRVRSFVHAWVRACLIVYLAVCKPNFARNSHYEPHTPISVRCMLSNYKRPDAIIMAFIVVTGLSRQSLTPVPGVTSR